MAIDVEGLLEPVSEESPCGPSLAYDAAYLEMERAAEGTPERQIGESVIEAVPPDWRDVGQRATVVLGGTKDLRVMLLLAVAALDADGVVGLRDGLKLIRGGLERYWDQIHPQLDPEDDNDPTERMNIVASLAMPLATFGDPIAYIDRIYRAPLTESRQLGRFGLRDVMIARGDMAAPSSDDAAPPSESAILAAFEDTAQETLQERSDAVTEAMAEVVAIDEILMEKAGPSFAPDLSELTAALRKVGVILGEQLGRHDDTAVEGGDGQGAGEGPGAGAALSGEIRSRDDVRRAFDKICRYFETQEPSSPVPVMVRRAERLIGKSFVECVKDIAPGGLGEVEVVGGEEYRAEE